jgi:hypothetical protein
VPARECHELDARDASICAPPEYEKWVVRTPTHPDPEAEEDVKRKGEDEDEDEEEERENG